VDEVAKGATEVNFVGPEPVIPVSRQLVKSAISRWERNAHSEEWRARPNCRQSKDFFKVCESVDHTFLRSLSRSSLRIMTQVITGHNTLQRHLWVMREVDSPICKNCGTEEETSAHYLGRCPRYSLLRNEILGSFDIAPEDFNQYPLSGLTTFVVRSGRFNMDLQGASSPIQ
jgi:hypothetical protein